MNEHGSLQSSTMKKIRGLFFILLGGSLLLHALIPTQYLSKLIAGAIGTLIIFGSVLMVLYGLSLLGVHINVTQWLHTLTKD